MERVIIIEIEPCCVSLQQKEKTHVRLSVSGGGCMGFVRFLNRVFAESAKRYGRLTCQRSSCGVATNATGAGGGAGEDLHR
jgi:hypothetical protein